MRSNRALWLLIVCILLAVGAWMTSRPAGELEFEPRPQLPGFRTLLRTSDAPRVNSVASPLVGLDFALSETKPGHDAAPDICKALFRAPGDPVVGPADAPVTIVEFFDYQCPYCRVVATFLSDIQAHDRRVRLVFKEWPVLGQFSELAARAALVAAQKGRYPEFHKALMALRGVPTEALIRQVARKTGFDPDTLLSEAGAEKYGDIIRRNRALARQIGLLGTPAFVVGRTIVDGAVSRARLERLVEMEAHSSRSVICPG